MKLRVLGRIYEKSGTIRSFNSLSEIDDEIKAANLKRGQLSAWVNDKITKGLLYEKDPPKSISPSISQGQIIGVELD